MKSAHRSSFLRGAFAFVFLFVFLFAFLEAGAARGDKHLTLLFTGDNAGEVAPCG